MNKLYFETYSRKPLFMRRQYYWRLLHTNGQIIAQGEGYNNRQERDHALDLVKGTVPETTVLPLG